MNKHVAFYFFFFRPLEMPKQSTMIILADLESSSRSTIKKMEWYMGKYLFFFKTINLGNCK